MQITKMARLIAIRHGRGVENTVPVHSIALRQRQIRCTVIVILSSQ